MARPDRGRAGKRSRAQEAAVPALVRRWLRSALLGLVCVLALVGVGLAAGRLWGPLAARRLLARMEATYRTPATYAAEGITRLHLTLGESQQPFSLPFTLTYAAPNRVKMECGGPLAVRVVSDGEAFYLEAPALRRAARAPAPASIGEMIVPEVMGVDALNPLSLFGKLSSGELGPDQVDKVTPGFDPGIAWLAALEQPAGSRAVTVVPAGGTPLVLWLDRRSGMVRQVALEVPRGGLASFVSGGLDAMGPEMAARLGGVSAHAVTVFGEQAIGAEVPEEAFSFQARSGVRVVPVSSLAGVRGVLLEGLGEVLRGLGSGLPGGIVPPPAGAGPAKRQ